MYALGLFEGVIDRLGALVRDLYSMASSLILGALMVIFLLGLVAWGLFWWRAL